LQAQQADIRQQRVGAALVPPPLPKHLGIPGVLNVLVTERLAKLAYRIVQLTVGGDSRLTPYNEDMRFRL
jgi:hypothetical protein